ncbi:MAG: ParB/RepB/Spo0J family partition protein [Limisphaerales bacterium]
MAKPVLGRGLGALFSSASPAPQPAAPAAPNSFQPIVVPPLSAPAPVQIDTRERVQLVPVAKVKPCPFQPRKDFSEEALKELASSIKEQGIVQPLIVRTRGEFFELIAGERRWRAAQIVGLTEVPIIVRQADDRAVLELALIENLQRENLNPIEEALGYSQLIEQFKLTQQEAAAKVGKSRTVVANALRLLKLAPDLQAHVRDGRLSVGHAKVILGLSNWAEQKLAAERILKSSLNVRQTEDLIGVMQKKGGTKKSSKGIILEVDPHVAALEEKLQQAFGTKVALKYATGKGSIEIKFFSDDDLDRILKIAGVPMD